MNIFKHLKVIRDHKRRVNDLLIEIETSYMDYIIETESGRTVCAFIAAETYIRLMDKLWEFDHWVWGKIFDPIRYEKMQKIVHETT